eukprot:TRINITY_DN794_c0_g2_i1.p1 TRINITY_DN794_c0_g2~~TRINITY_DN794_c0_g2_i1.p1  ORF type:complete len:116 (+),score=57.89 TRINITY_DN794_c0_g2_i1:82-429(+)
MIRRPPRSTQSRSSAASDVYKRQTQNGVVEEHAGQVGLTGAGDEEVTEDGSDSESDTSEGDGGEAGTDVVETVDGDGDGGGGAGGDDAGGGGGHGGTADGGGTDTAHHGSREADQ